MTISIEQTKRDIDQLQQEQRYEITPNIDRLTQRVAVVTAQATLDPALRGELQAAVHDLEQAEATVAANAARAARIQQLEQELVDAEQEQRTLAIEQANGAIADARIEYIAAGKTLIRAYRRLLDQQRRNQRVPGAHSALPGGFDFVPANPPGWTGSTASMMQQGLLPFEKKEESA